MRSLDNKLQNKCISDTFLSHQWAVHIWLTALKTTRCKHCQWRITRNSVWADGRLGMKVGKCLKAAFPSTWGQGQTEAPQMAFVCCWCFCEQVYVRRWLSMWPSLPNEFNILGKQFLLRSFARMQTFPRMHFSCLAVIPLKINHPGGLWSLLPDLLVKSLWGR